MMSVLVIIVLSLMSIYLGTIHLAFVTLMRLPLRLNVENSQESELLMKYLHQPAHFFLPSGVFHACVVSIISVVFLLQVDQSILEPVVLMFLASMTVVLVCLFLLPFMFLRPDPVTVLKWLLPPFDVVARRMHPLIDVCFRIQPNPRAGSFSDQEVSNNGSAITENKLKSFNPSLQANEKEAHELIQSVVDFGNTLVKEVMTRRSDIVAIRSDSTLKQLHDLFTEEQYSRLPVYRDNLDDVEGFVFLKDFFGSLNFDPNQSITPDLLRPATIVQETKPVAMLLKEFQTKQVQIAIVRDDFGGTSGLVTVEDLLEEIVGEIRDEYDVEFEPIVQETKNTFVFDGTVDFDKMCACLRIEVERQGFETVGGYILNRLGRVPGIGESFSIDTLDIQILDGEKRRIKRLRISRRDESNLFG